MKDLSNTRAIFDAEYFYQLRKEKNLTLRKLSRLAGVEYFTLSRISRGLTKNPGCESVYKLAVVLDVLVEDLMKEVKV